MNYVFGFWTDKIRKLFRMESRNFRKTNQTRMGKFLITFVFAQTDSYLRVENTKKAQAKAWAQAKQKPIISTNL